MNETTLPEQLDERPGVYQSPWPAFPGHIRFHHPFIGSHYQAYVKAWHAPAPKGVDPVVWEQGRMRGWRAARAVLVEWEIRDVPFTTLTDTADNVPLGLITWAGQALTAYLAPFLTGEPSPVPLTPTQVVRMD